MQSGGHDGLHRGLGGGLLEGGERGSPMSWDPSCLAACFLWFLAAGRPTMPGCAMPGGAMGIHTAERRLLWEGYWFSEGGEGIEELAHHLSFT